MAKKVPVPADGNDKKAKTAIAEREERILAFWQKNRIFEKSLEKNAGSDGKPAKEFIFYDGPPFATGEPHYGHILAGTIKDAIPRYKMMRGFHVPRRWGWDCHGLPIENMIEKELGLSTRKDIELYGVEKFNAAARASVLRYDAVWKHIVPRTGRFVDMDNAYLTMDWRYTESIWWSFKQLAEGGGNGGKSLVYQGFKPMHICPRCETTLSNFEVGLNYKEISDISVYVKFELVDEPGTFLLAWTTTPWTLPGNVALAVNPKTEYVLINVTGGTETYGGKIFKEIAPGNYIIAKNRWHEIVEKEIGGSVQKEFFGKNLIGKKYKPVFPYYENPAQKAGIKNSEHFYNVVPADFVTTTDGTGIVHIAPGFGEDDYNLSLAEKLPFIQPVGMDGRYTKQVSDFQESDADGETRGMQVKPIPTKDSPQEYQKTDVAVIKYLAAHGSLFAKEKITHSYPHCWRCDTPLLNYAASSWFVQVTAIKEKLLAQNQSVHWVPPEIGQGRFGNWLENAKDWSVSRSRFWGAPLPVWQCKDCNHTHFIGSVAELQQKIKRNRYFVMRHGQTNSNVANIISSDIHKEDPLTPHGREQVKKAAADLLTTLGVAKIDHIFSSPFERTQQTAKLVAETIGHSGQVVVDERLRELASTSFEGKSRDDRDQAYAAHPETAIAGDETWGDARRRIHRFLYDVDAKYSDKTILVISHAGPLLAFGGSIMDNAEVREVSFAAIPHDERFEFDLHRPYIDAITFPCESCGGVAKRIPDVFDTWYESGSMPFASVHFPFEQTFNAGEKKSGAALSHPARFPADFIAEGQDQTRGWFYSLLVLGTGLFGQSPYKNVVVNGTILAEDGQKMSKRLKNYPDVEDVLNKYGADAMRYYLLSSPAVAAEDVAFTEKGLDEVVKKLINRLENVYAFYALYTDGSTEPSAKSEHILDRWILARLAELANEVTAGLESYQLDKATRPFAQFIDDLSTWYLRRSRDRFKGKDATDAIATTRFLLKEVAKLLAPFMPFLAEDLYSKVKTAADPESVHLETWPEPKNSDAKVLTDMAQARTLVSLGLESRAKAGIKVRQPLATLFSGSVYATLVGDAAIAEIICDEVNVKQISTDPAAEPGQIDTILTPELKNEGIAREFIRFVQGLRKDKGLNPNQDIVLSIATSAEGAKIIETYRDDIQKVVHAKKIVFQQKLSSPATFSVESIDFRVLLEA